MSASSMDAKDCRTGVRLIDEPKLGIKLIIQVILWKNCAKLIGVNTYIFVFKDYLAINLVTI